MNEVLIAVDLQRSFIDLELGTPEAQAMIPYAADEIKKAILNGEIVIFTQDTHTSNYLSTFEGKKLPVEHCMVGTPGWDLDPRIKEAYREGEGDQFYFVKKSSFGYDSWRQFFDKYDIIPEKIRILGLCSDICVVVNALILRTLYPEISIIVDAKGCAGTTPEKHKAAMEVMKSCQIEVENYE